MIYNFETGGEVVVKENGVAGEHIINDVTKIETSRKKKEYEIFEFLQGERFDSLPLNGEYELKLYKLKENNSFYNSDSKFELTIRYRNDVDVYSGCEIKVVSQNIKGDDSIEEIYTIKADGYSHVGGY